MTDLYPNIHVHLHSSYWLKKHNYGLSFFLTIFFALPFICAILKSSAGKSLSHMTKTINSTALARKALENDFMKLIEAPPSSIMNAMYLLCIIW